MNLRSKGSSKFLKASASASIVASVIAPSVVHVQAAQETDFSDLSQGDLFYNEIQSLVSQGVIHGFPDHTIRAQAEISRAQVAAMVASALGLDSNKVVDPGFSDVEKEKWYYGSIAALAEVGVIQGDANANTFRPEESLTRSEIASVISQAFNLGESESGSNTFEDVSSSDWFAGAVGSLYEHGITKGKSATSFAPKDTVSRGEVAAFLYRSLEKGIQTEPTIESDEFILEGGKAISYTVDGANITVDLTNIESPVTGMGLNIDHSGVLTFSVPGKEGLTEKEQLLNKLITAITGNGLEVDEDTEQINFSDHGILNVSLEELQLVAVEGEVNFNATLANHHGTSEYNITLVVE